MKVLWRSSGVSGRRFSAELLIFCIETVNSQRTEAVMLIGSRCKMAEAYARLKLSVEISGSLAFCGD